MNKNFLTLTWISTTVVFVFSLGAQAFKSSDFDENHILNTLAPQDKNHSRTDPSHNKPYSDLDQLNGQQDSIYPSERTIFYDQHTGTEIWKLTHDPYTDMYEYYDVQPWNLDGSILMFWSVKNLNHVDPNGKRPGSDTWLMAADTSWLRPMDPNGDGERYRWSWLHKNQAYYVKIVDDQPSHSDLMRVTIDTQTGQTAHEPIFNLTENTPGSLRTGWALQPLHPLDDTALFKNSNQGTLSFWYLTNLSQPILGTEIPYDGRWDHLGHDGLHRLRWTKAVPINGHYKIFFGQKGSAPEFEGSLIGRQYTTDTKEGTNNLTDLTWYQSNFMNGSKSMIEKDRTLGHPDWTMDGDYLTGNFDDDPDDHTQNDTQIWKISELFASDPNERLRLYKAGTKTTLHSSNTWDGRWHVADHDKNQSEKNHDFISLREISVESSITSISQPLGRSQNVICKHYATYGLHESTDPTPGSSPDGTKIYYNSDMLFKGQPRSISDGNADCYIAILRRPFPPQEIKARALKKGGKTIIIDWKRPHHADRELFWNQGNLSREIKGYNIFRSEFSGGPYLQINSSLIKQTHYADTKCNPNKKYYYVVQAIEHSGLASLYSNEVHQKTSDPGFWHGHVRHFYEAEYADITLPAVQQRDWKNTSGGWYVGTFAQIPDPTRAPLETTTPSITFSFDIPATPNHNEADIYFLIRAAGFTESGWSGGYLDVSINGQDLEQITVSANDTWTWLTYPLAKKLETGMTHTLDIKIYDDGIGIDMICVTSDPNVTPPRLGNGDIIAPSAPLDVSITDTELGNKKISWLAPNDLDIQYFNIYYSSSGVIDQTKLLFSPPVRTTSLIDWAVPDDQGIAENYYVTAVDRYGNESSPSQGH